MSYHSVGRTAVKPRVKLDTTALRSTGFLTQMQNALPGGSAEIVSEEKAKWGLYALLGAGALGGLWLLTRKKKR